MLLIFSMNRYIHSADPEPTPQDKTRQNQTYKTYKTVIVWGGAGQQKALGIEDFPAGVLMGTITEKTLLERQACTSRLQEILGGDLQFAPLSGKGHRK